MTAFWKMKLEVSTSLFLLLTISYVYFAPAHSRYFTTSYGQVGISYLSDKRFKGSFISDTGLEITFVTEWDHDYEYTAVSSPTSGNILSSYYIDFPYRLLRAQNTWVLNDFRSGYTLEASFLSRLTEEQLPKVNRRSLYEASAKFVSSVQDRAMTSSSDTADWSGIVLQEEMQLLPSFSFGLVELGYTGTHYPILQKLHQISSRIYPHLTQSIEPVTSQSIATVTWCSSSSECEDEEKMPDKDDLCLGMCGPECKCWCWVCGDCCLHQGCYEHDMCCRNKVYSFNCWFPFNFSCDSFSQQC